MSNKKILIFTQSLNPGGSEKQSIILANILSSYHNVTLLIYYENKIDSQLMQTINSNVKLKILKGTHLNKMIAIYKLLRKNKINIIFSYLLLPNLLGGIIGRISKVEYPIGGIRSAKIEFKKVFINKILQNYINKLTIYNNYSGYNNYIKMGFNAKRASVIPNCVINIPESIHRKDKDKKIILSVGRLEKVKDYYTALLSIKELLKINKNIIYKIVGYGSKENTIRKWIDEMRINEYVQLIINPNDISKYYSEADIFLLTSLFEGLPNTILEAMSYSLPVVSTNVGDTNQLIKHGENGFLCKIEDYKNINKMLNALIVNYQMRIDFGQINYNIINQKYSISIFRENYIKLINNLH